MRIAIRGALEVYQERITIASEREPDLFGLDTAVAEDVVPAVIQVPDLRLYQ